MAFALEHFPTFPYPPSGMQEVEEIERYLTSLHRSMQEFFSLLPRDIKDGISVVDLDDLANTTLADPDADRIVFWDDGAGVYTWLTANTGLAISTTNLNLSHLGLESLTDPGADRIFFWDDGETASKWLAPDGTSLEISATTLQVKANGINDTHIDWGTGANQVSAVDVPIADAGSYYTGTEVETALQEAMLELKVHQLTGFEDASSVALSTDSGNPPTITLTFTGTVYWWSGGIRYSDSGTDALQIANSSGVHWIYYDGATLSSQVNPSDAELDAIITDKALVSIVYFNATTNASYVVANELHGVEMPGETHRWLHESIGSRYHGGLTISGYTLDTATDSALTFEVTDGSLYDEDLLVAISDGTAANQYEQQLSGGDASIPVLYRNAAGEWTEQATSTLPYIVSGTTLRYMDADNSYTQTSLGNSQYMNMFLVATNDWQYPIKMIQGTDEYSQIDYVQGAVAAEIVDWSTLPSAEWILLYQIILKQASGESVDGKIIDVIDYRFADITGASATSQDHGSLSGLADNDHAQYILHSLADAANDFLVASGDNVFVKKTLAETGAILEGDINHDNLVDFVANEHIDWTGATDNLVTSGRVACNYVALYDSDDSNTCSFIWQEDDSTNRQLNLYMNAGDRSLNLSGNLTVESASLVNQDLTTDASPTFAVLTVSGNLAVDTDTLFVNAATNRVGMGTTTPASFLDMREEGAILAQTATVASSTQAFHSPRMTWKRARNTLAVPQTIVANDVIGLFSFQGYDGSGYIECGLISVKCQTNPTDVGNIVPTRVEFKTMDAAGALNENFRIMHDRGIMMPGLKSGDTQANAGAAANELWYTDTHATLPDYVVMMGV